MLATLGIERGVIVQPSVYGTDNSAMLDAIKAAPAKLRGVAVVADDIAAGELERMHEAGVRGVRVNIVDVKDRKAGTLPLAALKKVADKIKPLGWHMEFLMHVDEFPDLDRLLADFPVPTVYGHLGYMKTDHGTGNPGFQALLRMMKAGRAWVKLTGPYRISAQPMPHADTNDYAHALLEGRARASRVGQRLAARHGERRDAERRRSCRHARRVDTRRGTAQAGAGRQSGAAVRFLAGNLARYAKRNRAPSSPNRATPLTSSATPTDSATENSASRRPIVFSITANVETHGT